MTTTACEVMVKTLTLGKHPRYGVGVCDAAGHVNAGEWHVFLTPDEAQAMATHLETHAAPHHPAPPHPHQEGNAMTKPTRTVLVEDVPFYNPELPDAYQPDYCPVSLMRHCYTCGAVFGVVSTTTVQARYDATVAYQLTCGHSTIDA